MRLREQFLPLIEMKIAFCCPPMSGVTGMITCPEDVPVMLKKSKIQIELLVKEKPIPSPQTAPKISQSSGVISTTPGRFSENIKTNDSVVSFK